MESREEIKVNNTKIRVEEGDKISGEKTLDGHTTGIMKTEEKTFVKV